MSLPALRVLLVEDSEPDATLIARELKKHWTLESQRVETAEQMLAALKQERWDVVLSDWSMPRFTATAALAVLHASNLDLPFLIVSGTIGEDATADAMRVGVHDVVLKDRLARLAPAVERELREAVVRAERRKAEEALREIEARYRRLTESGIIGVAVTDLEGAVEEANDACLGLLGFTRQDAEAGKIRWAERIPAEFRALAERAAAELVSKGAATPWEMEAIRKDGSRVACLVGVAALDFPRCIAFTVSLAEQRLAQAARHEAETALGQIEAQLRHAQKMEAVGRLAGGVAHDFNNVLSVILSYGELLLGDLKPGDPLRADVDEIFKAATRAASLTRQLLTFSRQQVVQPRVLDLRELLSGMEEMLRRLLGEDVELSIVAPPEVGRVLADPTQVEQVVMNIVVNARDAMPTGGTLTIEIVRVDIDEAYARAHVGARTGPHLLLAITDTGTGMPPETQARIFEPFFTTKEQGKGTGLGLSTAFGIVQQAGGSIFVDSAPGRGTTFKVYLPEVDAPADSARTSAGAEARVGTETILLVEDEPQVRAIAATVLGRQGYRVIVAASPAEAMAASERHAAPIDILVTDVVMPGMSGPELARRLSSTRPTMKVLCMSGYTDDSVLRHGVLGSGIAFLQKPFTPAILAKKVREVLEQAG